MDFQSSRAQFALDAAAMSVLQAWENSQRHAAHYPNAMHRPQLQYNNGFPISPISPSSSPASSRGNAMSLTGGNQQWAPMMSELDMDQLRRDVTSVTGPLVTTSDREPRMPAINGLSVHTPPAAPAAAAATPAVNNNHHNFFNFDFTLPQLPHIPLQHPSHQQQRCSPPLPTPTTPRSSSAVFSSPPVTPPNNMTYRRESPASTHSHSATKRSSDDSSSSATTPSSAKKSRAYTSLRDFVPPDVSGLSKREARLVKNRAAAFLSRQRKREEFELMEIRVAELERENARLREMADGSSPAPISSVDSSELELLRMQLAASRQREADLVHRLEALKHEQQKIKTEANEPSLSDSESSETNSPVMAPNSPLKNIVSNPKAGASLGLMVLLCALPSLLSQPSSHSRPTLPTSQSFLQGIQWDASSIYQTSASATIDEIPSWELDFSGTQTSATTGNLDMDVDYQNMHSTKDEPEWQKLELGLEGGDDLGLGGLGLGSLDISFATSRTKDGRIRVRVHPSSSSSSSAPSLVPPKPERTSPTPDDHINPGRMVHSLPSPAQSHSSSTPESDSTVVNPLSFSFIDTDPLGPFLGAGSSPTGTFELGTPFDFSNTNTNSGAVSGVSGLESILDCRTGERRRVRIALRSLPQPGGEGGEWEIEVR